MMKTTIRVEKETTLNKAWLHIYTQREYYEDYQMPMIKKNKITGILPMDGCEVEGCGRYTYDTSGFMTVQAMYEKRRIKKADMEGIVRDLIKTTEELRRFMLNPDSLILQPECIFQREGKRYFCYLPGYTGAMNISFHELTEYFVKMVDYEDMEGICLAYELHKATLQEHYNLPGIMKVYKKHERVRNKNGHRWEKEQQGKRENYGNIFSLTEEEESSEKIKSCKGQDKEQKRYQAQNMTETICEEKGRYTIWKKAAHRFSGKRWGQWNDLIMETDGQERKSTL